MTQQLKPMLSHLDHHHPVLPTTPGKLKATTPFYHNRFRFHPRLTLCSLFFFIFFIFLFCFCSPPSSTSLNNNKRRNLQTTEHNSFWESKVRKSARTDSGRIVLLTGAAGFVGTHLAIALKHRGDGVVGFDNFNGYYELGLKKARKTVLDRHGVFIVKGDLNDGDLLTDVFGIVEFTHVVHLAAQAGVRYAMQNPGSYVHSNIKGFVSLLEACKNAYRQPIVVWASSSSVYGLNSKVPFSENDRTDQPASLYAATKKAGEEIAHAYNHIYGLSITGLRFFTVYGPWGRPDMAYYFFTKDILRGKEIKIFEGDNHATVARDFTYIDDVVKGCLAAIDTAKKSTGSGGKKKGDAQLRIYNLGNTKPVPVGKLVSILEKLLKVKAKKKVLPMPRNGDVPYTHANISLARSELGYKPTTDLETGLKKFVKWYVDYYGSKKKSAW